MKFKKLSIETDGRTQNTVIKVDGVQLGCVQSIEFSADVKDMFAKMLIKVAKKDADGNIKKKKARVRDPKTEKTIDSEEVVMEMLLLERDEK